MAPFLSIIIPAHNEEARLGITLEKVFAFLSTQPYESEVLVIENGSRDQTYALAASYAGQFPAYRVVREAERGKGRAVRRGMQEATGEYRFMCDADLSMPITELVNFLPPVLQEFDVAIGSREAKGAVRYNEPTYRHLGGRAINLVIRLLALPGLHDSQCGFKCFRAAVAEDLFGCQTLMGWSFDIELLYVARRRKYKVVEVPIHWYFSAQSKINPIKDALRMVADIMRMRANARRGMYEPKN